MAKSGGTTRASSSVNPTGVGQTTQGPAQITANSIVSSRMKEFNNSSMLNGSNHMAEIMGFDDDYDMQRALERQGYGFSEVNNMLRELRSYDNDTKQRAAQNVVSALAKSAPSESEHFSSVTQSLNRIASDSTSRFHINGIVDGMHRSGDTMHVTVTRKSWGRSGESSQTFDRMESRSSAINDKYIARRAFLAARRTGNTVKKVVIHSYYD